jgi:acyl-CoA dehydrogenase
VDDEFLKLDSLVSSSPLLFYVSLAQRCYDLMLERSLKRATFGMRLYEHGSLQRDIADSFSDLQASRLLTLHCAHQMDLFGPEPSRRYISAIKVAVPSLVMRVLDRALQAHGGAGVCQDTVIASAWANMRTLRIADGPDEVHRRSVALLEIKKKKTTISELQLVDKLQSRL